MHPYNTPQPAYYNCKITLPDNDAYIPELWAREGLMRLQEDMLMANLVHRDFQSEVARFGDVVNTRRPRDFKIRRKVDGDCLDAQPAISDNVQVPLDQHFVVRFPIYDGEESLSFLDLVEQYIGPAMHIIARAVDRVITGQMHRFIGDPEDRVGRLTGLTGPSAKTLLLQAREQMNRNLAPMEGRHLIVSPASETSLLSADLFIKANERGDGGTALEEARLGRVMGFNTWMSPNVPYTPCFVTDQATGQVDDAQAVGATGSLDVTLVGHEAVNGEFVTVAGNDQPQWVVDSETGAGDTTEITFNEPFKFATSAEADLVVYKAAAVDGTYADCWSKGIKIDGYTSGFGPRVGQLIAFGLGDNRHTYTIIEAEEDGDTTTVHLDRPLEDNLTDNQAAFPGPCGSYNLAFHRNALALVTRPLALPRRAHGVLAGVANFEGLGMRVLMQYDDECQATMVTFDILAGVALLDERLGVLVLG